MITLRPILILACLFATGMVQADNLVVYECELADGSIAYSNRPCTDTQRNSIQLVEEQQARQRRLERNPSVCGEKLQALIPDLKDIGKAGMTVARNATSFKRQRDAARYCSGSAAECREYRATADRLEQEILAEAETAQQGLPDLKRDWLSAAVNCNASTITPPGPVPTPSNWEPTGNCGMFIEMFKSQVESDSLRFLSGRPQSQNSHYLQRTQTFLGDLAARCSLGAVRASSDENAELGMQQSNSLFVQDAIAVKRVIPEILPVWCNKLDNRSVHLWSTNNPVDIAVENGPLVIDLNRETSCPIYAVANEPMIHPMTKQLYYIAQHQDPDTGKSTRRLFYFNAEFSPDNRIKEVPTHACPQGIGSFHFDPSNGAMLFNCLAPSADCQTARYSQKRFPICLDGPWYDSNSRKVTNLAVIGIDANRHLIVATGEGFAGLAIRGNDDGELDFVEPPDIDADGIAANRKILALRAYEKGFAVVLGHAGKRRDLYRVNKEGKASWLGELPNPVGSGLVTEATLENSWALDADLRLYDDLGGAIGRADTSGQYKISLHADQQVGGGESAWLLTGP